MLIEIRGIAATLVIIAITLGLGLGASRAGPAALILDVEGPRQPNVRSFDELATGMSLDLGEATRIVFQHYATCDEVTVIGGKLYFFEERYLVRKGKVVEVHRSRCPETVELGKPSKMASLILRDGPGGPKIAPRPVFVLMGGSWRDVVAVRMWRGEEEVANLAPEARRVPWPEDAGPLIAGREYEIELVIRGEDAPRRSKATARKNAGPLTLLRLD